MKMNLNLLLRRCATLALMLAGGPTAVAASEQAATYSLADFAEVAKFDAHVHANSSDPALIAQARADGFELLSINVDYPDFPPLAQQAEIAHTFLERFPQRFHYATTFSMRGWDTPGWAERVNAAIAREHANGAVAVKVWKNIGMSFRDADGELVMIDDAGFRPVWNKIRGLGIPLIGHQGEPRNCWLPLDQMTTANDRAYFANHPQYHMYLHPEMPSYEDQMAARDRMVAANPTLAFVGAHMASLEWSVDELARFLDSHPNAVVDLAARMTQVQYQSVRDYDKVRDFFIRYQDRLLYGSDLTQAPGSDPAEFRRQAHAFWLSDWRYLATAESQRIDDIDADARGLALPRSVIDKIYRENARRVFLEASYE